MAARRRLGEGGIGRASGFYEAAWLGRYGKAQRRGGRVDSGGNGRVRPSHARGKAMTRGTQLTVAQARERRRRGRRGPPAGPSEVGPAVGKQGRAGLAERRTGHTERREVRGESAPTRRSGPADRKQWRRKEFLFHFLNQFPNQF